MHKEHSDNRAKRLGLNKPHIFWSRFHNRWVLTDVGMFYPATVATLIMLEKTIAYVRMRNTYERNPRRTC